MYHHKIRQLGDNNYDLYKFIGSSIFIKSSICILTCNEFINSYDKIHVYLTVLLGIYSQ